MFIYLLIGIVYTCDYQSMYANITDTNALIPISTIEYTLTQVRVIPDTADLTNITLYTKVISNQFSGQGIVTFQLRLSISYTFQFGTFQSIGYAIMDNVIYTLQITQQFKQVSTTLIPQNQFNFIGLQQYTNQYSQAVSSINSQIPQQLQSLYQSIEYTFNPIPQTYTYTYINNNEDEQSIIFNYQSNYLNYTDNILTLDGQLLIENFDGNICQQTILPTSTASLNQVQLFSTSVLESIIQYSYQQQYFNVLITNDWKSTDFQFYLGSFSNILLDLEDYNPLTPVTGWCNVTELPLYTATNITLNYQCDLKFNQNINLLLINMNLTLGLEFIQFDDTIQIIVNSINSQIHEQYYGYPPRHYQKQLAELYLKTILNEHILNRPVFGSGFRTIPRTNPNVTLTNDYLILYEQ